MRRYWTNAGKACACKRRCTSGHDRRVSRWPHAHLVEPPFGTIKSWTGPCHVLTRRLGGVGTDMALNVLDYTIKRRVALVGIKGLMAAIPG